MEKPFRVLVWHDKSETLVEVGVPLLADMMLSNGEAKDVTNIPEWEEKLQLQKQGIAVKNGTEDFLVN